MTPETTPQAAQQALNSGRELPVVAVKRGTDVEARTIRQSDRPKGVDPALSAFKEFQPAVAAGGGAGAGTADTTSGSTADAVPTTLTTVETFSSPPLGAKDLRPGAGRNGEGTVDPAGLAAAGRRGTATGQATATAGADTQAKAPDTGVNTAGVAGRATRKGNTDGPGGNPVAVAASASAEARRQAALADAKEAAKQPPKEPISKILMDQVQALWAASRSVVDASTPTPKPGAPTLKEELTGATSAKAKAAVTANTAAASTGQDTASNVDASGAQGGSQASRS